jgi:nicotinate-nucleotide pyrophosphorylase (carboxylating)
VLAGLAVGTLIADVFGARLGVALEFAAVDASDGDEVKQSATVATLAGPLAAVLSTERTLLNFLGRLSGVATHTRRFVRVAQATNPHVQVLDTRKTLPGWRELDKYAVRCGGGLNHRRGLDDAILIKDNHLAAVPVDQWAEHLSRVLSELPTDPAPAFVEVEVDTLAQLEQVLQVAGVDMVLLDNFSAADLREAVALRNQCAAHKRPLLEASGGVTLATIGPIAATGVDRISVGALTHSAVQLDFGLDWPA